MHKFILDFNEKFNIHLSVCIHILYTHVCLGELIKLIQINI
jgi:hypothetical protein